MEENFIFIAGNACFSASAVLYFNQSFRMKGNKRSGHSLTESGGPVETPQRILARTTPGRQAADGRYHVIMSGFTTSRVEPRMLFQHPSRQITCRADAFCIARTKKEVQG